MIPKSAHLEIYIKSYDKKQKVCPCDSRSAFAQVLHSNLISKGLEVDFGDK